MDLYAERDRLAHKAGEGWDWIEAMRKRRDVMDDPRKRQKVDRVEDQTIQTIREYERVCDELNQPAQTEMGEVA